MQRNKMYGSCTERKTINRNSLGKPRCLVYQTKIHIKYFKYVKKAKENHENDASPNREYQLRDRNYKRESNGNSQVENYNIRN